MDRLLRHTIQNTQELTVLEEKIFIEYIKCKIIVHASTNIDIHCSIFPLRRCECCLTDWLIENPQRIKQFRLNIPTMDEKKWKDITGASTAVMYRMYYQLMYLFENSQRLNFPITVIVNGDGSQSHKEEFMKVYQKFQRCPPGINFSMTGLIDRAGTLEGAECETQKLPTGAIDWGDNPLRCNAGYFDNLYFGIKGNVFYCCHDYHQEYSCGNINDTPLKELLCSELPSWINTVKVLPTTKSLY